MKKQILIITDYNNLYRQDIYRSEGIQLDVFKKHIEDAGYSTKQITYQQLLDQKDITVWKDYYIFYTSSENIEYKEYIKDILYILGKYNVLIPRFDLLMCHEDKLYQEIFKKELGICSLDARLYSTMKELIADLSKINFPVIVKNSVGSGSISVYKAENKKALIRIARKIMFSKTVPLFYMKALYKKLYRKLTPNYFADEKYFGRLVLQEYVKELVCDWKVLVFGEKYYVLRRNVRKKDFRASGSGLFSFEEPDVRILNYAQLIYQKMDVPFLSLDLCIDQNNKVYLIEFQGIHFGPYTLINSPHYFINQNGWKKKEATSCLAEEYANAVIYYLTRSPQNEKTHFSG